MTDDELAKYLNCYPWEVQSYEWEYWLMHEVENAYTYLAILVEGAQMRLAKREMEVHRSLPLRFNDAWFYLNE